MSAPAPSFDFGTFEDLGRQIVEFVETIAGRISSFLDAVNDLLGSTILRFLGAVRDAIKWLGQQIVDLAQWCWEKVKEAAEAVMAPLTFAKLAYGWGQNVQTPASAVAAVVQPNALRAQLDWTGDAANRYKVAVSLQGPAATSVSSMGGSVLLHLGLAAAGGFTFYAVMVGVAVKFVSVMGAATVATASGIAAPAGLGASLVEAGTDAAVIAGAIAALTALLASQVSAFVNLGNAGNNQGAFPNDAWPVGTA